jgi:thiol-disulfide isomerase/thioredoxin
MITERPLFPVATADIAARPARLRVYTTFATWCPSCRAHLPMLKHLKEELGAEGVDMVAVPIDAEDDNRKLAAYAKEWKPSSRLVNLAPSNRTNAVAAYTKALGEDPPLPSTVITDASGHILSAQPGVPSISALRKILGLDPLQK